MSTCSCWEVAGTGRTLKACDVCISIPKSMSHWREGPSLGETRTADLQSNRRESGQGISGGQPHKISSTQPSSLGASMVLLWKGAQRVMGVQERQSEIKRGLVVLKKEMEEGFKTLPKERQINTYILTTYTELKKQKQWQRLSLKKSPITKSGYNKLITKKLMPSEAD